MPLSSPTKALPKMGGLDIGMARRMKEEKDDSEEASLVRANERPVLVIFDLPDGSQIEEEFQMGQTVEYLKAFLSLEAGVAMDGCKIFRAGEMMMDPLSLMDFEGVGEELEVTVEGSMEEESRK
jgi:hypothetical protein